MLKTLRAVRYPWVSRDDRRIYERYPGLDPVGLGKKCFLGAFGGYWVGRLAGWNRTLTASVFTLPLIAKFLVDEWRLSRSGELKGYN